MLDLTTSFVKEFRKLSVLSMANRLVSACLHSRHRGLLSLSVCQRLHNAILQVADERSSSSRALPCQGRRQSALDTCHLPRLITLGAITTNLAAAQPDRRQLPLTHRCPTSPAYHPSSRAQAESHYAVTLPIPGASCSVERHHKKSEKNYCVYFR